MSAFNQALLLGIAIFVIAFLIWLHTLVGLREDLSFLCRKYGFEKAQIVLCNYVGGGPGVYEVSAYLIPNHDQLVIIHGYFDLNLPVFYTPDAGKVSLYELLTGSRRTYVNLDDAQIAVKHARIGLENFGQVLREWQPPVKIEAIAYDDRLRRIDEALR